MREAPEQNVIEHAAPELRLLLLQQYADIARAPPAGRVCKDNTVQFDGGTRSAVQPGERVHQRRLAAAVAPEYRPHLPRFERDAHVAAQHAPRYLQLEVTTTENAWHQFLRPSSHNIAGTPTSAISTPTGSCCGAHAVRAAVSARVMRLPPSSTARGSSARWCDTPSRRTA